MAARWRRYYPLVAMAAMTGMRQGELRGVYKTDLDFSEKLIRVRRAANAKNQIGLPKSGAGVRDIEMPDPLVAILKEWLVAAPKGKLLFATAAGAVMDRQSVHTVAGSRCSKTRALRITPFMPCGTSSRLR